VQTDVPLLVEATVSKDSDFVSIYFPNTIHNFLNKYNFSAEQTAIFPPDKVLLYSGRDILTQKAVLLI